MPREGSMPTPWSRLIEVRGFGGSFIKDANRTSTGDITVSANQVSKYITFSITKASLGGTPAAGWAFTVTLPGREGSGPAGSYQERTFASTPQAYAFGVCAAGGSAAICSRDPNTVPNV